MRLHQTCYEKNGRGGGVVGGAGGDSSRPIYKKMEAVALDFSYKENGMFEGGT